MANYYFQKDFWLKHNGPINIPTSEVTEKLLLIMTTSHNASLAQKFKLFKQIFTSQNIF
jgi:hypothetical protein